MKHTNFEDMYSRNVYIVLTGKLILDKEYYYNFLHKTR